MPALACHGVTFTFTGRPPIFTYRLHRLHYKLRSILRTFILDFCRVFSDTTSYHFFARLSTRSAILVHDVTTPFLADLIFRFVVQWVKIQHFSDSAKAVKKISVLLDINPYSLEDKYESFGRICCLRDDWRWRQQFHPYLLYLSTSCSMFYARRKYCPLLKRMQRTFAALLSVLSITRQKSYFCTVLSTLDTTEHNGVISHTHTKSDSISAKCISNRNTWDNGHKQRRFSLL